VYSSLAVIVVSAYDFILDVTVGFVVIPSA